jgi:hypothetical protein
MSGLLPSGKMNRRFSSRSSLSVGVGELLLEFGQLRADYFFDGRWLRNWRGAASREHHAGENPCRRSDD